MNKYKETKLQRITQPGLDIGKNIDIWPLFGVKQWSDIRLDQYLNTFEIDK